MRIGRSLTSEFNDLVGLQACVPDALGSGGAEILICYPSSTPIGLDLGPD